MVSVPVIKFMREPSINRNVTEYLRNNHDRPQNEIEHDINRIKRDTLSSLPEEGTELDLTHERELIDYHKEKPEVNHPIFESIEDLSEEQFHDHCLVDEISNQCSIDQNSNSNPSHIIRKEEDQNDNQTSFEESIKKCVSLTFLLNE